MGRIRGVIVALTVSAVVGVAGSAGALGEQRTGPPSRGASRVPAVRVRMVDDVFRPAGMTVSRGTRVRWVNAGDNLHSSTSTSGVWDSGLIGSGESFSRVFRRAGSFPYRCTAHPAMRGTLTVT